MNRDFIPNCVPEYFREQQEKSSAITLNALNTGSPGNKRTGIFPAVRTIGLYMKGRSGIYSFWSCFYSVL